MTIEDIIDGAVRRAVREEVEPLKAELRALRAGAELPSTPLLTVAEVRRLAGKPTKETVRRWIASGKLKASKPRGRWLVKAEDLERFLKQQAEEAKPLRAKDHLSLVLGRIEKAGG